MKKILCFSFFFSLVQFSKSQTGLDPAFATGGIGVYVPMPRSQAQSIAVQADGKIIVAGLGSSNPLASPVIRLNTDGSLDPSFDGDGTVLISGMETIESIAIQPDGKIVMLGIGHISTIDYNVFMTVRLNTDGSFDNSFGTNGIVHVDIVYGVDYGQTLALQPDGKIVLAGNSQATGGDFDISIVRLLNNGSLDNSFDGDGKMLLERIGTTEYESGLVVQPDGKIVIEGKTYLGSDPDLLVIRINEGGGLDNSFGVNGIFSFEDILGYEPYFGKTLTLQPDGKILVGRNSYLGDGSEVFIALRLNPNGTLDNSFDSDGVVTVAFGTIEDICTSIAVQADGKIILSGYSIGPAPNTSDFTLARLNNDGSLDNCFNQTGKLVIPRQGWDEAIDMILQTDGKILVTGYTENPSTSFIVMRIQSSGGTGQDADGDGYSSCIDCNDNNPAINPGATEVCNNIDDDCDGQIDEGTGTFYRDADADGFGNPNNTTQACSAPAGYVTDNTDCDDTKILYVDNDGDGYGTGSSAPCGVENNTDCNDADQAIHTAVTYYQDADSDGWGNPNASLSACQATPPAGYVTNSLDCDDTKLLYADLDGDGFGAGNPIACGVDNNSDCNDNDGTVRPGAFDDFCNGIDNDCDGQIDEDAVRNTYYFDGDNDGWGIASQTIIDCTKPAGYAVNPGDCNDNNASVHPGATEVCNNADENCNGQIDEGALQTFFKDNDGDGYGNLNEFVLACTAPAGYVSNGTDCNDNNFAVNPAAAELCNGIDDDCDGQIDDGATLNTFYKDEDGDGYGNTSLTVQACVAPAGYVAPSGDCNDNDQTVNPGATEVCNSKDDDCDGQIDENLSTTYYRDGDGDGFGNPDAFITVCFVPQGYVTNADDCADSNPAVNPAATEICNEIDDDCDGQIDEGFTKNTYYKDADGDGYGDPNNSLLACTQPFGYVTDNTDCDDTNDTIHPNASEYCNGIDENCNGIADDNPVLVTWYRDADGDGWGDPNQTAQACTPPVGFIREALDCDDTNPNINPEATEIGNNLDDDCDGQIDEGLLTTFYRDTDNDGFGDPANSTQASTPPAGYVANNNDCNDNNASIHPGATETCNGIDDNCDGVIDEGIIKPTWYRDLDGDGYGNPNSSQQACTQPQGHVSNNTDCNDNSSAIHPGATEVCNNIDDDCNGQIDEGLTIPTWYRDLDGDGFGDPNSSQQACGQQQGYVSNNTDCNDNNASIYPTAIETCNGIDDNCDGVIDEGTIKPTWYRDLDGDGFGNPNSSQQACERPQGYVANNTDCNDNNSAIHPGVVETCNNIDDDCDGQIDEGVTITFYRDADNDGFGNPNNTTQACTVPAGYVSNNTDCDDTKLLYADTDGDGFGAGNPAPCGVASNTDCNDNDPVIHPNTTWYLDADNDNYYTGNGLTQCLSPGVGYKISGLIASGDCNDNNANVNPGRLEQCGNNIDDNCNGQIDEGCTITISINDVTVYESQGQAVLTVSLSKQATAGIKVNFKTIDGTAVKPKDYKNTNGSITIPAGSLSGLITIPIIQDNVNEGPEYFDVQISLPRINGQPQTATVNDDMGRVTILNGSAPVLTRPSATFTDSTKVNNTAGFDVTVTPNPSESDFIIHILGSGNEPVDIRVFDVQGRLVKQLTNTSTNVRLGSDFRSGMYLVEVKQAVFRRSLKLIKL